MAKVYGEGLIGCLVASPLSLASNPYKGEPEGILSPIYNWLAPFPKKLYLIEEKLKRFCENGYYTESIGYTRHSDTILKELERQCRKLSSSLTCITVDKKASGSQIVEIIKQHEANYPLVTS